MAQSCLADCNATEVPDPDAQMQFLPRDTDRANLRLLDVLPVADTLLSEQPVAHIFQQSNIDINKKPQPV